ncbi:unnamed protein product [Polarella glacialis]|uniref:Nudix hydrolase domain-containing protein n=1 Tax=Polarella glacialis TaxID=89957 RepID=A0A813KC91_POLGL|nr:unnamed protein product [Polarella glacialis]
MAVARPIYPRGAVAVAVCRQQAQGEPLEFLLARRAKPPAEGCWAIPGGKLELGEAALKGAAREISEETGLTAATGLRFIPWAIGTSDAIYPHGWKPESCEPLQFHYLIAQMFAFSTDWTAEVVAGDDAAALCWVTRQDVESGKLEIAGNVAATLLRAETMMKAGLLKLEDAVVVET